MTQTFRAFQILSRSLASTGSSLRLLIGLILTPQFAAATPTLEPFPESTIQPSVRQRNEQAEHRVLPTTIAPLTLYSTIERFSSGHSSRQQSNEPSDSLRVVQQPSDEPAEEARVLISEVVVTGAESQPELEELVYSTISTQADQITTRSQLQDDINAVFSTGFFSNIEAVPEDTPLGVRVTFSVELNPVLSDVQVVGSALQEQGSLLDFPNEEPSLDIPPYQLTVQEIADRIFSSQYGSTLNLLDFQAGVERLNEIYRDNGYVLAQVIDAPPPVDGLVQLEVAEGVIEDIEIAFLDEDGLAVDEDGEPIEGQTRDFVITREFESESGDVFNQSQIQADLQSARALGIFDDIRVALNPGDDPRKVDVTFSVDLNPVLSNVEIVGSALQEQGVLLDFIGNEPSLDIPPYQLTVQEIADRIFSSQYGSTLNLLDFQAGVERLNEIYRDNGYVLAQVIDTPPPVDGVGQIEVAEGVIEDIEIAFLDEDGLAVDEDGEPIEGETRDFVITREFESESGDVFNQSQIQTDLQRAFALGIFDDIRVSLDPGDDPRKVDVIVNVIEGSTGSVAAGVGFSEERGFFLTASYEQSNYAGRNQSVSAEAELGATSFSFDGSVNSSGAIGGISSLDELSMRGHNALLADTSDNRYAVVDQLTDVLNFAEQSARSTEVALTLNNLGNAYADIGATAQAINTYQLAQQHFQRLNSPALELLMWLRLADMYRVNGQPEEALPSYYNALTILRQIKGETRFERLLGHEIATTLQTEWHLNNDNLTNPQNAFPSFGDLDVDALLAELGNLELLLSFVELTILLDIGATFSAIGDYQQALYIVYSPELTDSVQALSRESQQIFRKLQDFTKENIDNNVDWFESENLSEELETLIIDLSTSIAEDIDVIINISPELARLLSLQFVYEDLNNPELVAFYQGQAEQGFSEFSNYFELGLVSFLDIVYRGVEIPDWSTIFKIESEVLENFVIESLNLAEKWANPQTWDQFNDPVVQAELQLELDILGNQLLDWLKTPEVLDKLENAGLSTEDLDRLISFVESLLSLSIDAIGNEDDKFEVKIAEEILISWPSDIAIVQEYDWVRGFIFLIIAEEYEQLGETEKAIAAYASSIDLLEEGYEFIEVLIASNDLSALDERVGQFSSTLDAEIEQAGQNQGVNTGQFRGLIASLIDNYQPLILWASKLLLLELHHDSADLYLQTENPLSAKNLYQRVLLLNDELEQLSEEYKLGFASSLSLADISEIYYGIAQAEFALGNLEEAQLAVEEAVSTNERFFPKETLAGGTGFTRASFQYGYGAPNSGNFSLGFSISSSNPWFTPIEPENDPELISFGTDSRIPPLTFPNVALPPCSSPADYFACRQKYFDLYLAILQQRHQQSPSENFNVLAFEQSERARTNSLEILQNLTDVPNIDGLSQEQRMLLIRQLRLNEPAPFNNMIRTQALEANTLLLEYFLGEETSYLWVLTPDGRLQTFNLPPRAVIEAKAREFYELLTVPSGRVRPRTTAEAGQDLSQMLLGAIADQLDGQRLLIVGDGFLQYIPFTALPDPNAIPSDAETATPGEFAPHLVPLLLNHEIVMLPSASALVAIRQDQATRPQASKELALFADPVFNHADDRVGQLQISHEGNFQRFESDQLETIDILYGALPATTEELSVIEEENLIPPSEWQVFSGYEANLENALSQELGQFRIVHFASHGIFNSDAPQRSGIVLSGVSEEGGLQAGLLSPAHAFNDMNLLGTELVVLSGCRTGIGRGDVSREGINGIIGGLLSAGTDRVVASLWSVQDEATRELMSRFYRRLLDPDNPMTAAQALRSAQISMWEDPRWQTPYYWAAFIIQGEYR